MKRSQQKRALYYLESSSGREPAREWISSLKDRVGKSRILVRIARAELGNWGDYKSVGDGVFELRVSHGPGYRIYFGLEGADLIILLAAGDKSSQSEDIARAKSYWQRHCAGKQSNDGKR
jgi:putative addiction module killer protein